MTLLDNLVLGLEVALRAHLLIAALIGSLLGLLAAGLPRIGLTALLALLLPVAQLLEAGPALVLLAGMLCGAHHGRPPRWSARRSSAAPFAAPGASAASASLGLLIAALLGSIALALLAPPVTELSYHFGPAEYVALIVLGLIAAVVLAAGSVTKSLAMLIAGLLLAQVGAPGADGGGLFGELRELGIAFDVVPIALGAVTLTAVIALSASPADDRAAAADADRVVPTKAGVRWRVVLRASSVGSLLGVLPGATSTLAPLAADRLERGLLPMVQRDGLRGPTDPEAAHAAAAAAVRTGFVPLLALGVPLNGAYALLAATLLAHGQPLGPQLMTSAPELFWGLIVSLMAAAPVLYLLAVPAAMLARRLGGLPDAMHAVLLVGFACIALLATREPIAIGLMAAFAVFGYLLFKLGCPLPPLLLGVVLWPVLESNLRHALRLSDGDWSIFATRPLAAGLLLAGGVLVAVLLLPSLRARRAAAFGASP